MPAGIGLRPPLRRAGIARLAGGRCAYPLHTLDPTGTVFVERSRPRALGDFFTVWGQRLAPRQLLSFPGPRAGLPQRPRMEGRPAADAAPASRRDRARGRRLRPTALALPLPGGPVSGRLAVLAALVALALVGAGCGGGGGSPACRPSPPPRSTSSTGRPAGVAKPGEVDAEIRRAHARRDGADAVPPRRGPAHRRARDRRARRPHGDRPQAPAGPRRRPSALPVDLPRAGRYHVLVDVYPAPATGARQLPAHARPAGGHGGRQGAAPRVLARRARRRADVPRREAPGSAARRARIDGRRRHRRRRQAGQVHAVLRRAGARDLLPRGTLDYFHSHICGNDPACSAGFGTAATTGHSTKPGQLELGVLLPATGKWRLFLQVTHDGKLLTAPFTLRVR